MVRPGSRLADDRPLAPGVVQAPPQLLHETGPVHMMRAAGQRQQAARRHQAGGQPRQLAIGAAAGAQLLAGADEGRRVADHDVEALAAVAPPHQVGEGVAGRHRHPPAEAARRRRFAGQRQRRFGAVHHGHALGAAGGAGQPEAAAIAIDVQHAGAAGQPRHEGAVLALVEEPAGLLPRKRVGAIAKAVLQHPDGALRPGADDAVVLAQALQAPRRAAAAQHHRFHPRLLHQGGGDLVGQPLHAGGGDAGGGEAAIAVDDHAGQAVGLGMGQPVMGVLEQPPPQVLGARDAPPQPGAVDPRFGRGVEAPRGDQRMGVEDRHPQGRAVMGGQPHRRARRQRLRRAVHLHLVRKRPGMPPFHAPLGPALQEDGANASRLRGRRHQRIAPAHILPAPPG